MYALFTITCFSCSQLLLKPPKGGGGAGDEDEAGEEDADEADRVEERGGSEGEGAGGRELDSTTAVLVMFLFPSAVL